MGRRAFAIAGPSAWNSLQDPVRNPNATESFFHAPAKDAFVRTVLAHPAYQGGSPVTRYTNQHINIDVDSCRTIKQHN